MQHSRKSCIFIGLLEETEDAFHRPIWKVQLEGAKTAREPPGIVDQIATMVIADYDEATGKWTPNENGQHRIFVCTRANAWGYPAGTRASNIEMIEEPDLGKLLKKLHSSTKGLSNAS
jgi:hypothetical protein